MLEIVHITKTFTDQTAKVLDDVGLTIKEGEFFSLLGPSGCGKTTLLRIISGLEEQTLGQVLLDGKDISKVSAQKRPFNMVFQRYALFPHLTVIENLKFGLQIKKVSATETKKRVDEMLQLVGLEALANRYPETLSGGQAQRVALARAIVNQPRILLLDEPLSALDLKMREQLQTELVTLQKKIGLTFIHVTHDQEEAMLLSDRIAVMNHGKIEQIGQPQEIYHHPQTQFVAEFVGSSTRISGMCISTTEDQAEIQLNNGQKILARCNSNSLSSKQPVMLFVRPEKVKINTATPKETQNSLSGVVKFKAFKGPVFELHIEVPKIGLICATSSDQNYHKWNNNDHVEIGIESADIRCFGA